MNYRKYRNLVDYYFATDNREENYQNRILIAANWKLKKKNDDTVKYGIIVEVKTPSSNDRAHAYAEVSEYLTKVPFVILTDCITWEFYHMENDNIQKEVFSLEQSYIITNISKNNRYKKKMRLKSIKFEYPTEVCKRNSDHSKKIRWIECDENDSSSKWTQLCHKIKALMA